MGSTARHTRAIKWLWIGGFPFAWYVVSFAVYHAAWASGLLAENASGVPTLLGHELGLWLLAAFPIVWLVATILAMKGRLPGTRATDRAH